MIRPKKFTEEVALKSNVPDSSYNAKPRKKSD